MEIKILPYSLCFSAFFSPACSVVQSRAWYTACISLLLHSPYFVGKVPLHCFQHRTPKWGRGAFHCSKTLGMQIEIAQIVPHPCVSLAKSSVFLSVSNVFLCWNQVRAYLCSGARQILSKREAIFRGFREGGGRSGIHLNLDSVLE